MLQNPGSASALLSNYLKSATLSECLRRLWVDLGRQRGSDGGDGAVVPDLCCQFSRSISFGALKENPVEVEVKNNSRVMCFSKQ